MDAGAVSLRPKIGFGDNKELLRNRKPSDRNANLHSRHEQPLRGDAGCSLQIAKHETLEERSALRRNRRAASSLRTSFT